MTRQNPVQYAADARRLAPAPVGRDHQIRWLHFTAIGAAGGPVVPRGTSGVMWANVYAAGHWQLSVGPYQVDGGKADDLDGAVAAVAAAATAYLAGASC